MVEAEGDQMQSKEFLDLISRQLGTFGSEMMGKLVKMKVLIVGMRGLGVETAKNLILASPKAVDIYDPTEVSLADLGSNFYLGEGDIGAKTRAQASIGQLGELNPYVTTHVLDAFNKELVANYNVVCITENFFGAAGLREINEQCRSNKVGFLLCETMGVSGYVFSDFGDQFFVNDPDGVSPKQCIVRDVTQEENGLVLCDPEKRHPYQDGDHVKFVEIEGMTEINSTKEQVKPFEIFECTAYTFRIKCDTRQLGKYTRQGIVENVKVPKAHKFHSFDASAKNPAASTPYGFLEPVDMNLFGMGRSENLHLAFMGVHAFHDAEGRYPGDNEADLAKVVELTKGINAANKESDGLNVEEIDEAVCRKVAAYSTCSITSMCAFFGGFLAQEIVKFTGKYMPLRQWMHVDYFDSLPTGEVNRAPMGSRYDDQIKIYGREVQEKLGNVRTFMVGAGALGCEFIKAMALMGLGCGEKGSVTVTDNDNIEVSNLNRQFLFRANDVNSSKAVTACRKAQVMNPALKVITHQALVCPDTEDVFNDEFWEPLDFIVNAVDNVKARLYMDQRCIWYEKPLLESGTLGTAANSQMVVPRVTKAYGDSKDQEEDTIPFCSLRNFPSTIEHCIEWGREKFNAKFVERVQNTVECVKDLDGFLKNMRKTASSGDIREKLEEVNAQLSILKGADVNKSMVMAARAFFFENFEHGIRDLIAAFPEDAVDSKLGQPFWSGAKRFPNVCAFDSSADLVIDMIHCFTNLVAATINKPSLEVDAVKAIVDSLPPVEYVQKNISKEGMDDEEEKKEEGKEPEPANDADDEPVIAELTDSIRAASAGLTAESFNPAEFEKDDDTNFHIDFINAVSNLRARNYRIEECDRNKTKMLAGKIIPAIATTTAMITGLVCCEIFKFTQGFTDIEKFKDTQCNLALPMIAFVQPDEIQGKKGVDYDPIAMGPVKVKPENFTNYDKMVVEAGSLTIQGLIDHIKEHHGVEIYQFLLDSETSVYYMYEPKDASKLGLKVEDAVTAKLGKPLQAGKRYIRLECSATLVDTGDECLVPPVKYFFA